MSWDIEIMPDVHEPAYERNLTFNNSRLLSRAGAHPHRWHGLKVSELRPLVAEAHALISDNRAYFSKFNPPVDNETGKTWGGIDDVIRYLEKLGEYLATAPDQYVMKVT